MGTYVAHYKTLNSDTNRQKGEFDFESQGKLKSRTNEHDARLAMLERFGNAALSWQIYKIEKKKASTGKIDGQLQLDFRGPAPKKRKSRRKYM